MMLMYHSVEPYTEDPFQVTVRPERFEQQMKWLHRRGLRGVSMRSLLAAESTKGLVGLTFDDGYTDFLTRVVPVLERFGFTATVFVLPGRLGGHNAWDEPGPRKPLMTTAEIRRAAAAGMEIGSHGLVHQSLPACGERVLTDEVSGSRTILADLIGQEITGFCYPYGHAGQRELDAVRSAGYDYASAVRPGELAGRYALPRTFVGDRDHGARLYAKWARHTLRGAR
jgi:peptidoglycan/xylan/chitin deacetylase (PgdA/CDA1 family)